MEKPLIKHSCGHYSTQEEDLKGCSLCSSAYFFSALYGCSTAEIKNLIPKNPKHPVPFPLSIPKLINDPIMLIKAINYVEQQIIQSEKEQIPFVEFQKNRLKQLHNRLKEINEE